MRTHYYDVIRNNYGPFTSTESGFAHCASSANNRVFSGGGAIAPKNFDEAGDEYCVCVLS